MVVPWIPDEVTERATTGHIYVALEITVKVEGPITIAPYRDAFSLLPCCASKPNKQVRVQPAFELCPGGGPSAIILLACDEQLPLSGGDSRTGFLTFTVSDRYTPRGIDWLVRYVQGGPEGGTVWLVVDF
jgi:hypothetical protein